MGNFSKMMVMYSVLEMVKEIRNAAELRENLLVSKVESLIEQCLNSKNMVSIFFLASL